MRRPCVLTHRALLLPDVPLVLVPKMFQRAQDRRDLGVAERADSLARDVAAEPLQLRQILVAPLAVLDPGQDVVEPRAAFPARRALPARFVVEETYQVVRRPHHA